MFKNKISFLVFERVVLSKKIRFFSATISQRSLFVCFKRGTASVLTLSVLKTRMTYIGNFLNFIGLIVLFLYCFLVSIGHKSLKKFLSQLSFIISSIRNSNVLTFSFSNGYPIKSFFHFHTINFTSILVFFI